MSLQDKKKEKKEKGRGGEAKPAEAAKDSEPRVDQLDIRCRPAMLPDIKASWLNHSHAPIHRREHCKNRDCSCSTWGCGHWLLRVIAVLPTQQPAHDLSGAIVGEQCRRQLNNGLLCDAGWDRS